MNGSLAWITTPNSFGATAQEGTKFLDLTDYRDAPPFGGVEQSVATCAGCSYQLTFYLGSDVRFGIQDALSVLVNGSSAGIFASANDGTQINLWELETLNFTASGNLTTIALVGGSGMHAIGLDNVSLVQTGGPVSGVPEPATWAMMLIGFVGLGVIRRRRSAVA